MLNFAKEKRKKEKKRKKKKRDKELDLASSNVSIACCSDKRQ